MQTNLDLDLMKADGLTDDEIAVIRQYLDSAASLDNTATVVQLGNEIRLVCRTLGLAIRAARPEAYLGTMEEATRRNQQ